MIKATASNALGPSHAAADVVGAFPATWRGRNAPWTAKGGGELCSDTTAGCRRCSGVRNAGRVWVLTEAKGIRTDCTVLKAVAVARIHIVMAQTAP